MPYYVYSMSVACRSLHGNILSYTVCGDLSIDADPTTLSFSPPIGMGACIVFYIFIIMLHNFHILFSRNRIFSFDKPPSYQICCQVTPHKANS